MRVLSREERDFAVCSDCTFYKMIECIDPRYPAATKGRCILHDKLVVGHWETNCEDLKEFVSCYACEYCYEDEMGDTVCKITGDYVDFDDCSDCEHFRKIED